VANETYQYDPNGRTASITSSQFGMQQYAYDADGRLTTSTEPTGGGVSDPAQISYSYYGNGARAAVSVTSPTFTQFNALAYSYRADGLLQKQTLNAFTNGSWSKSYTDAGRPSAVSGVDSQSKAYDSTGQLQSHTIGSSTLTFTHDPEGSPLTEVVPAPISQALNNTFNVRGELVDSFYAPNGGWVYPHYRSTTAGGCIARDSIPLDGSALPDTRTVLDARSCAVVNSGTMLGVDYNMISYPVEAISSFAFDTVGRLTRSVSTTSSFDAGGVIGMPPLAPTDPDFGNHANRRAGVRGDVDRHGRHDL
jgi:YD repeat-containing protein